MNAYSPIQSMQRLEGGGFARKQAETLAEELHGATVQHVTKDELTKALEAHANKLTLRLGSIMAALAALIVAAIQLF